jgi:hypothetical protein
LGAAKHPYFGRAVSDAAWSSTGGYEVCKIFVIHQSES